MHEHTQGHSDCATHVSQCDHSLSVLGNSTAQGCHTLRDTLATRQTPEKESRLAHWQQLSKGRRITQQPASASAHVALRTLYGPHQLPRSLDCAVTISIRPSVCCNRAASTRDMYSGPSHATSSYPCAVMCLSGAEAAALAAAEQLGYPEAAPGRRRAAAVAAV
jgi:hypothetical protein